LGEILFQSTLKREKMFKGTKVVHEEIAKRMMVEYPHFSLNRERSDSNLRVYEWNCARHLRFKLAFRTVRDGFGERFTIEVGWTNTPTGFLPNPGIVLPRLDETEKGIRFRLAYFWEEPSSEDRSWWNLSPEQSLSDQIKRLQKLASGVSPDKSSVDKAHISNLVDDAMAKIKQYCIPYFDEVRQLIADGRPISDLHRGGPEKSKKVQRPRRL
jgi:hypothetical protein